MPSIDDDITLSFGIDAQDAIDTADKLQSHISEIFKKTSGNKLTKQFNNVKRQMDKANTKAENLKSELNEIGNTKVNSKQYDDVIKKLEEYRKLASDTRKDLRASKDPNQRSSLKQQLANYKQARDYYQQEKLRLEQSGQDKISGTDSDAYHRKAEQLGELNNTMRESISSAYELDEAGKSAADGTQLLANSANSAQNQLTKLQKFQLGVVNALNALKTTAQNVGIMLARLTSKVIIGAVNGFKSLGKAAGKAAINIGKVLTSMAGKISGLNRIGNIFSRISRAIGGTTKSATTSIPSFKKLISLTLKWGLGIRSIFILWRKLRAYTTDALKLMATQFEEVDADVSALMNSFNQMKLSMGTMAQPLMHALRPALVYIIELITRATTALANFFAILTGQKFIYKAQKANDSYADSIKGVGGAAKEANKELAEYDNLLVIDQPKDGSGGGGSGAAEGLTGTFEKTLAESDFAKQLKDAINRGDWEGVGGLFAGKLNIITKKFDDWVKEFRPKSVKWAQNIGRILGGFIDGWNADLLGRTVGDTVMTFMDTVATWWETVPWKKLGGKIADAVNGLVDTIEPNTVGRFFAGKINAIIDFAAGLVDPEDGIKWKQLGSKLGESLKNLIQDIHWDTLGADLSNLASGILTGLSSFIVSSQLGTTVGNAINEFLSKINFGQLAKNLSDLAINILDALADVIITIDWKRVGEAIADFLTGIDWLKLLQKLGEVALALLGAFAEALSGLASNPKAVLTIAEALLAIFAAKKIWSMLTGMFSTNIGSALSNGIGLAKVAVAAGTWELAGRGAGKLFEGIASAIGEEELAKEYGEFAKGPTKYLVNAISTGVEAATEYSETTGRSTLSNAVHMLFGEDYTGIANANAKNALDAANETLQRAKYSYDVLGLHELVSDEEWEKFKNSCDDYVAEINRLQEETQKSTKDVKDSFDSIPTSAREAMQKAAQETSDGTENITESVHVMTNGIPSDVETAMQKTSESVHVMANGVPSEVEEAMKKTSESVHTMANGVPSEVEEAMKKASEPFHVMANGIPSEVEEAMKKTATNMVVPFDTVPDDLGTMSQNSVMNIEGAFEPLADDLGTTANNAMTSITTNFAQDALTDHFTAVKENIETPFTELPAFFSDTFKESWNKAEASFSDGNTTFGNFNSKLSEGMTNTINGLIDGLNNSVSTPFRKIQEVIDKFKNVKIGSNALFSHLPSFSGIPSIPRLAQGAVIPPNREFLATLGDQTSGTNIETPLETMVQAFKQALSEMGSSNNQNIVLQLDSRTVAQCVWDEEDKRYKQTGRR